MAKGKITKTSVERIRPRATEAYLWDTDLIGFGVKVTPQGRRVYLIQYRIGGRRGVTRRYTIGRHGEVTADQARKLAKKLLGQVASGSDPRAGLDQANRDLRLTELWETFWTQHISVKRKQTTANEYARQWHKVIKPRLGKLAVNAIKPQDISRLHHALRKTPYQANRILALLSRLFSWAEEQGFRDAHTNPCRFVEKFGERKRERFLSIEELARLAAVLAEREKDEVYVVAAIRLLIFTGCRLNEIMSLKWEHVDFERGQLCLPESKTGQKVVFLNAPARDVLDKLPRLEGNPHVICGRKEGAHLVNLQKPWRSIREAAGLEGVRLHDLRHSFASFAAAGGQSLPMIGKLLGHSQLQTTARYAHLADDPVRAANEAIGQHIAAAMVGKTAKIVSLKRGRHSGK